MGKNVLGISFGRRNSNSDIMVKAALMECEKAGHSVQFINTLDLDIKDCTGCIACVVGLVAGFGKGDCVLKDDFHVIHEALLWCDALIVACPTFVLSPTGTFKTVCDRLGPSHDIAFLKSAYERGVAAGKPADKLPDPRAFKPKVGALIAIGGAKTENWLSFMLPTMYEITFSSGIDVIDMHKYFGAMAYEHVLGNEPEMERSRLVGRNINEALAAETEEDRIKWRGDTEGVCPLCHCDMLTVNHENCEVECPTCGIAGQLTVEDGKIKVDFPESVHERARLRWGGKEDHFIEISTGAVGPGQIPDLKERLEPYKSYLK